MANVELAARLQNFTFVCREERFYTAVDQCSSCKNYVQHIILFSVEVQEEETEPGRFKIRDNTQKIKDILKRVNAVMNSGGGAVLVHLDHPYLLNDLDEQLNDKMQKQIADDSLFHQNFERRFIDDRHVVFRIIPKPSPLSTYNMNSKLSRDTGLADVTDGQMRRFIRSLQLKDGQTVAEEEAILRDAKPVEFYDGAEIEITKGTFQECSRIQAKRVTDISQVTNLQFWKTKIAPYISSFSKICSGGSIYLGIEEGVKTSGHKKEIRTGKFLCGGIRLSEQAKKDFEEFIKENTKTQLLTLLAAERQSENSFIQIKYHPVKKPVSTAGGSRQTGRFVIELVVRNIYGVCFLEDGPEAYEVSRKALAAEAAVLQQAAQGPPASNAAWAVMPRRLSRDDWFQRVCASDELLGKQMDKLPTLSEMETKLSFSQ